jgi:large subunit ribosomal protein L28
VIPIQNQGGVIMARCEICDKGVHFGNAVSHSHRRSNKIWKSNIKSVKVKVNGAARKMNVCTSCLRAGKVERA